MATITDPSSLNSLYGLSALNPLNSLQKEGTSGSNFSEFLVNAMSGVQQTDTADKIQGLNLLTGDVEDLHTAVLAGEKAELTLRLTTTIRTKVIDAYNELMRMQV